MSLPRKGTASKEKKWTDRHVLTELKASILTVGQLSPIIKDKKTDEILSGQHRWDAKGRKVVYIDLDDLARKLGVSREFAKELVILHANIQRRPSEEEVDYHLQRLNRELKTQRVPKGQRTKIIAQLTHYSPRHIQRHLHSDSKRKYVKNPSQLRHMSQLDVGSRNQLVSAITRLEVELDVKKRQLERFRKGLSSKNLLKLMNDPKFDPHVFEEWLDVFLWEWKMLRDSPNPYDRFPNVG